MLRLTLYMLLLLSCSNSNYTAEEIVDQSIIYHGGDKFNNTAISFRFRDKSYFMKHSFGAFDYRRIFKDSSKNIMDRFTNNSFERSINGKVITLADSMAFKYKNSVNSVIYFASLPFRLKDEAVNLKRLDDVEINGESFYKIYVTFRPENGGKDFEDEFCYWFRKSNFALDYMAYSFLTDGGGARFRVRTKTQTIKGIRFLNYDNYSHIENSMEIASFDKLYGSEKLVKLSEINLENIEYHGTVVNKED